MAKPLVVLAVQHPLSADSLSAIITQGGFRVETIYSSDKIVSLVDRLRPEIVLVGCELVSGREFLVKLLAKASPASTVLLLADEESAVNLEGAALTIDRAMGAESLIELLTQIVTPETASPPSQAVAAEGFAAEAPRATSQFRSRAIGLTEHCAAILASLTSLAPLAQLYLANDPPAGIDFPFGVANVAALRRHFGLWVSLWDPTLWSGDAFGRAYGVLSSYLALPFAIAFGEGPGLRLFLACSQFLLVAFVYVLLWELAQRRLVACALTVMVVWSANQYNMLLYRGFTAQASAQFFLPLILFLLFRYSRTSEKRLLVAAATVTGLAFLTHPIVGGLIAIVGSAVLLLRTDHLGQVRYLANLGPMAQFALITSSVGAVIGVPLLANIILAARVTVAVAKGAPSADYVEPRAPLELFLSTNPVLLILLAVAVAWLVASRIRGGGVRIRGPLLPLTVIAVALVAAQLLFALGLNPTALFLKSWRTWWIATIVFAGVVAAMLRAEVLSRISTSRPGPWRAHLAVLVALLFVAAAAVAPSAGWQSIKDYVLPAETDPQSVADVLMGLDKPAGHHLLPEWVDSDSLDSRAWTLNPRITMWWPALHRLPITNGYYDPAYKPWVDWRALMQMAINGNLATEGRFTREVAKKVAKFSLDWYAIRYFITSPGGAFDSPVADYLSGSDVIEDSALIDHLQTLRVRPELTTGIVSATNAPTILVVGEPAAYDTFVRVLAMAGLGSKELIPLRGPQRIDDLRPETMGQFSALILYDFDYSDRDSAFAMLEQYVRAGGGLFIDTGHRIDLDGGNLPAVFPINRLERAEASGRWDLLGAAGRFGELDVSRFSPPDYEGDRWKISYAPSGADLRAWAAPVLSQANHPLFVEGSLGAGRVAWSGMNLPFHAEYFVNPREVKLLADAVNWLARPLDTSAPSYAISRPTPESISLSGSDFSGVLVKESALGGWYASVEADGRSQSAPVYHAGPDFMYVQLPASYLRKTVTVRFNYRGQTLDWLLFLISACTTLAALDYVLLRGRLTRQAGRLLAFVAATLAHSKRTSKRLRKP